MEGLAMRTVQKIVVFLVLILMIAPLTLTIIFMYQHKDSNRGALIYRQSQRYHKRMREIRPINNPSGCGIKATNAQTGEVSCSGAVLSRAPYKQ
jgi:hypothetical protein